MHGHESSQTLTGKHLSIFHRAEQLENEVESFNILVMGNGSNTGVTGYIPKGGTPFPTDMNTTFYYSEVDNLLLFDPVIVDHVWCSALY